MKNFTKLFGNLNRARSAKVPLLIIAFTAVIVFLMAGCDLFKIDEFPSEFRGVTWVRDFETKWTNTLTFTSNTLKDSTQSYNWELKSVSGDDYTIKSSNSDYTTTISIKVENGNLIISGDSQPTGAEHDWDGKWRKK